MRRSFTGAAVVTLTMAAVHPLRAQTIPSPYRFIEEGQEGGAFVAHLSPDRGRFGFGPGPGLAYGVRYGVELSGPLALEGLATFLPTQRDVIDPSRPEGSRVVEEAEAVMVTVEARLRFALTGRRTWRGMQPYVAVGGGLAWDAQGAQVEDTRLPEDNQFDFGTKFTGALAGGVRVPVGSRFLVRAEGSLLLWKLDTPGGFGDPELGLESVPEGEWVNATGLSVGLAWRW